MLSFVYKVSGFPVLCSIWLWFSLDQFKNGSEYLMRMNTPSVYSFDENFFCWDWFWEFFLFFRGNFFFISPFVWGCPLPIFQGTWNFLCLQVFWFFLKLVVPFLLLFLFFFFFFFHFQHGTFFNAEFFSYILTIFSLFVPYFFLFGKYLDISFVLKVMKLFLWT